MKLKRFVAKDMRDALTMVKDELGADAIIMSNKRVATGVEIVAGVESLPNPQLANNAAAGGLANLAQEAGGRTLSQLASMAQGQNAFGPMGQGQPALPNYSSMPNAYNQLDPSNSGVGGVGGARAGMGLGGLPALPSPNTAGMANGMLPSPQGQAQEAANNHQIGSALANLANAIAMSGQQRVLQEEGVTLNSSQLNTALEGNAALAQGNNAFYPNLSNGVANNVDAGNAANAGIDAVNGPNGSFNSYNAPRPLYGNGAANQAPAGASGMLGASSLFSSPSADAPKDASNKYQAYAHSLIEILERQNAMSKEQGAQLMENIAAQQSIKQEREHLGATDPYTAMPADGANLQNLQNLSNLPSPNGPNVPCGANVPNAANAANIANAFNQAGPAEDLSLSARLSPASVAPNALGAAIPPLDDAMPRAASHASAAMSAANAAIPAEALGLKGAQGSAEQAKVAKEQGGDASEAKKSTAEANVSGLSPAEVMARSNGATVRGGMRSVNEESLKGTGVSRIINPVDGEDDDMANDPLKKSGPSRIDPSLEEDADLFKNPPLPLSQQREFKNFFGKSKARQEKEDYDNKAGIETYRSGAGTDAAVVRQDLEKMRTEVESIRKLLQFELAGLLQDNRSRNEPVKAMIYKLLHSVGFSDHVSDLLVNRLPAEISFNSAWREIVKLLEGFILVGDDEIISQGGIVTLIGPAGVGKTTTLAKLAARFVMRYGPQRVAIITADHYRIGAVEQIKTYGRIMGCSTFAVKNLSELPQLLYTLSDKSLILVDTAGVGFKDERFNTQMSQLKLQASLKLKHYLVLPCTTQRKVLQHAYEHFSVLGLTGLILTKIDECQNLGDALSLCIEMKLPVSYITDGQRVPEDLNVPNPHSLTHRALSAIEDDAAQRSLAASLEE